MVDMQEAADRYIDVGATQPVRLTDDAKRWYVGAYESTDWDCSTRRARQRVRDCIP